MALWSAPAGENHIPATLSEVPSMCGRYTLTDFQDLITRFQTEPGNFELAPRYNIAPEQLMPVVVREEKNRLELMQWGLVPFWSKEPKSKVINARIEGILTKPSFKRPIRYQRCLVPATGYYEWKKDPAGKAPYYIRRKDGSLFAFAGIYDRWKDPAENEIKTFAILTTAPNQLLAQVHNRMPVILQPEQESLWLTADPGTMESLLKSLPPLPQDQLEMYPVSRMVNWAKNDSPQLIQRED